jgi:hypothetical protein
MSMSDNAENRVLTWLLTASAVTRPTSWTVGLFTAAPSDAAGGTEVAGNAYARQSVTFTISGTNPTQAANSAQIEFPAATPSGWGTVTHAAIFDNAGTQIWWGPLAASNTIAANDIFRFAAGAIVLTLD